MDTILPDFVSDPNTLSDYHLSDEEAAIVNASIDEAHQPGAVWYNDAEFDQKLEDMISNRRQ